jgi:hypothetical protein
VGFLLGICSQPSVGSHNGHVELKADSLTAETGSGWLEQISCTGVILR